MCQCFSAQAIIGNFHHATAAPVQKKRFLVDSTYSFHFSLSLCLNALNVSSKIWYYKWITFGSVLFQCFCENKLYLNKYIYILKKAGWLTIKPSDIKLLHDFYDIYGHQLTFFKEISKYFSFKIWWFSYIFLQSFSKGNLNSV